MTYLIKFFLCGSICAFLFPPFFIFPLGFLAFPYLYFVLNDKKLQRTNKFIHFIYGTSFGIGLNLIILYWVREPFFFNSTTINYSSLNKSSAHCYKKVYAERLSRNSTDEAWKKELKTKVQIEGNAAAYAGFRCLKK